MLFCVIFISYHFVVSYSLYSNSFHITVHSAVHVFVCTFSSLEQYTQSGGGRCRERLCVLRASS